jgi:hypothetical protein
MKDKRSRQEQKRLRTQQIIFAIVAVILILSWVLSLVAPSF